MKPLETPHLPSNRVKTVIMAGDSTTHINALQTLNIEVLTTQRNKALEQAIFFHADMLCFHLGCSDILLSEEQTFLCENLSRLGFKPQIINETIRSPYPMDALLNGARIGKYLVCNPNTVSDIILENALIKNLELIKVRQGYAKCSICVINGNAIITEDIGIKQACEKKGIDTLIISKGSVKLKNHAYGFLGGCTGLIDNNKLAVCGNLKNHEDYPAIDQFLRKHHVEAVNLTDAELIDIGGILPITQNF